jgi:hypothetical protein
MLWTGEPACLVLVEPGLDGESNHPERDDWEAIVQGSGLHAVVFDEDGACLYTTPGIGASDLRTFRREILADEDSRNAFDAWMKERPDTRSQTLDLVALGTMDWHACEISWRGTDAGLLWALAEREPTFN